MTFVLSLVAGVLLGSAPTAEWLARARDLDLRSEGSGNPGANNALQLGGPGLGGAILAAEVIKGMTAVWLGHRLAGAPGAALAGAGATVGNVYNPWYGLEGGKGLAITSGTVAAAWPALAVVLVVLIGASTATLRRTGPAALLTLAAYVGASLAGWSTPLPGRWAITEPPCMAAMAVAQTAVMAPKHYADAVRRGGRPGSPAGS